MLKFIRIMILSFSILLTSAALAGGREAGNGGNAIVCRDANQKIISAELLDFYEAKTLRNAQFSSLQNSKSRDEVFAEFLKRLRQFSPYRANKFEADLDSFFYRALLLEGQDLTPINDSFHISFPKNCAVEQLATQKDPVFEEDYTFFINADIWAKLSPFDQAGLMTHELLLNEAIKYNHTNTVYVRYLNAKLMSDEFSKMTMRGFLELLNTVHFNVTDIGSYYFEFDNCDKMNNPSDSIERSRSKIQRLVPCRESSQKRFNANKMYFDDQDNLVRIEIKARDVIFKGQFENQLNCSGASSSSLLKGFINLFNQEILETSCVKEIKK